MARRREGELMTPAALAAGQPATAPAPDQVDVTKVGETIRGLGVLSGCTGTRLNALHGLCWRLGIHMIRTRGVNSHRGQTTHRGTCL
jgi:hypothetical protein